MVTSLFGQLLWIYLYDGSVNTAAVLPNLKKRNVDFHTWQFSVEAWFSQRSYSSYGCLAALSEIFL